MQLYFNDIFQNRMQWYYAHRRAINIGISIFAVVVVVLIVQWYRTSREAPLNTPPSGVDTNQPIAPGSDENSRAQELEESLSTYENDYVETEYVDSSSENGDITETGSNDSEDALEDEGDSISDEIYDEAEDLASDIGSNANANQDDGVFENVVNAAVSITDYVISQASNTTSAAGSSCPTVSGNIGTVSYMVNLPVTGTYSIWTRMLAPDSIANSYWLQIDGNCPILVGDAPFANNTWVWVDYKNGDPSSRITVPLDAGVHTIRLIGREIGVQIDRLIYTVDPNCVPSGNGDNCLPEETSDIPDTPVANPTTPPAGTSAGSQSTGTSTTEQPLPELTNPPANSFPTDAPLPTAIPTPIPTSTVPAGFPTSTPRPPTPTLTSSPRPTTRPTATPVSTTNTTTPPPLAAGEVVVYPEADAYVELSNPSSNHGNSNTIQTDGSPIKIAYLRFNLEPYAGRTIISARLVGNVAQSTDDQVQIKTVADTTWNENTIVWNNRPPSGSIVGTYGDNSPHQWIIADISGAFTGKAGQKVSIDLEETAGDGLDIYSREKKGEEIRLYLKVQ